MLLEKWVNQFREREARLAERGWFERATESFRKRIAKEADSGSSQAVGIHASESELIAHERCKFLEGYETPKPTFETVGPHKFKVVMIEEGLGNLGDGFYYTKEALESARVLFQGSKIFADHPSRSEEDDRPERSVRDVIGHFEETMVEVDEKDGRSKLTATAVVLPDDSYRWARALMRHAVDYSGKFPDKNFIGLSINAGGSADPVGVQDFMKSYPIPESARPKVIKAMENGLETIRVVKRIQSAISCDLVTEPGAGGRVIKIEESSKNG